MAIRRNLSQPLAVSAFDGPDKPKKKGNGKKGNGNKPKHAGYYLDAREASKLMGKKPGGKLDTSYSFSEFSYDISNLGPVDPKDTYATTDAGTREYKRIQDVKRARKKKKAQALAKKRSKYKTNRASLDNY